MSTTIFKHELNMHLRSVITWSVAVVAVILLYSSIFSSFADQAAALNDALSNLPEAFRAAFGLGDVDLSTVLGYFSFVYFFVQVLLAIQAANYGFGLVSIEERELTADFLLAKPVARPQIMTSKLLAALASLAITQAVVWASTFGFLNAFKGDKTFDAGILVLLLLGLTVFQLFFLTVGTVVSLLVKRVRSVTPYAMTLGFGMYVLSAFGDMLGESALEKITPFKHFDPRYIVKNGAYDVPLVMISVMVIVISVAGSYWLYTRRDIPSVT